MNKLILKKTFNPCSRIGNCENNFQCDGCIRKITYSKFFKYFQKTKIFILSSFLNFMFNIVSKISNAKIYALTEGDGGDCRLIKK
jgi:hypothetical protein